MIKNLIFILFFLAGGATGFAQTAEPTLLQKPTVSQTQIAFVYAGDIWVVSRQGGDAKRLTAGVGIETDPLFSPDGKWIAFTGEYDGNIDVYVVGSEGGVPRRLTYHPLADFASGWTRDSARVLFRSGRKSNSLKFNRLFTISLEGGFPAEIPLPRAEEGSFSPDGSRLAYSPTTRAFTVWKRYRGGRTTKVWIANLSDSSVEQIPRDNSNDYTPMWIEGKVYFLSDRNGPVTLFAYDTASKKVSQVVQNNGLDIKSASAGPGVIVYEQFGTIYLLDTRSGKPERVPIRVSGDMPYARPRYDKVANRISTISLSPTGVRAIVEARGEILSVPAEKGDARNLTNTPGTAERDPAWSPDGKWIAYFSDESGEYALHLRDQSGMGEVRKIGLGNPPSFYYSPAWSPDSKKVLYTDKRLNLWYVDLAKATPVRIDTNPYESPAQSFDPVWSPDSRWIAYTRQLRSHMHAVFIYSIETGKSTQATDGLSDARYAAFDKNGKYLYFAASTNTGPTTGWIDMSSYPHAVTRNLYAIVLSKNLPSPLAPESDEEKIQDAQKAPEGAKPPEKKEPVTVTIDFDQITQRTLALPVPARDYQAVSAGKTGVIYLLENPPISGAPFAFAGFALHKFDLEKRKTDKVLDGINFFDLSDNGEKMLYSLGNRFFIASTGPQPIRPGEGAIRLDEMEVYVDPRAEWNQMYREVWRIERDFFYDPQHHGLDLKATEKRYEPYLRAVAHRADLTYLMQEMLGEMTVGHLNVGAGDLPDVKRVPGGLLGADYEIGNGRYRFARVYNGESWNPQLRAPLTQPGVNVREGEYLLAVNGRELRSTDNIYSFFESTANKSVVIKVGPTPTGENAREVTVVPTTNEVGLRSLAWVEDNRRKVEQLSGGRLAYVYLPDTNIGGYTYFNRYFFAQVDKEGAVIDERFNSGGSVPDYIIDYLRRPFLSYMATREGEDIITPTGAIFGPK
ncbi:MAG TPA: PDZ domain-containing protein, partial [Blastocatellia bacterium]|nr:PDZ domain-containing protein [Blastocatellia bacterium]